jgi:hypothetical protein
LILEEALGLRWGKVESKSYSSTCYLGVRRS